MFLNQTAIVLGAGASWHYGYPTGEALVGKIVDAANLLNAYCLLAKQERIPYRLNFSHEFIPISPSSGNTALAWDLMHKKCEEFIGRVKVVDPLVIDYFLGQNASLQNIGKFLISWSILESQHTFERETRNINRIVRAGEVTKNDNWYRFIVHKIVLGCNSSNDLHKNIINFITFNYDVSLERQLQAALKATELFLSSDIELFLSGDRIVHVYGRVKDPYETDSRPLVFEKFNRYSMNANQICEAQDMSDRAHFLNTINDCSKNLRIIDPHEKIDNLGNILCAQNFIGCSKIIFILGYGFDDNNNDRLRLGQLLDLRNRPSSDPKSVLFTNYENINRINKKAGRLFYRDFDIFTKHNVIGNPMESSYAEKSTNDVYRAFELDFETLESDLGPGTPI